MYMCMRRRGPVREWSGELGTSYQVLSDAGYFYLVLRCFE